MCSSAPVNGFTVQNAETKSTHERRDVDDDEPRRAAARAAHASQPGAAPSSDERRRAAREGRPAAARCSSAGPAATPSSPSRPAATACSRRSRSCRCRRSAIGVFQNLILLEVRERRVRVVLRARALLDLVHVRAGQRVDRRLAEVDRLLGLHLRRRDVGEPLVGAVRVLACARRPSTCRASRSRPPSGRVLDRRAWSAFSVFVW